MKLTKKEFKEKVKGLGYQIRFKKVGFNGDEKHVPVIKKGDVQITGGSVFTKEFFDEHKEVLQLVEENKMFSI